MFFAFYVFLLTFVTNCHEVQFHKNTNTKTYEIAHMYIFVDS